MKRFFLVLMGAVLFNFLGCGSSSDEGKALQQHNLKLVGIPQEIVVNICQDANDNGSCDEGELQAKVSVNANDSIAQMWEKVKFEANGRYVLENYDSTLNIIMEIDGSKVAEYNNVSLALTYKPTTQELSVLQAVVDADFLKEEEVEKFKALENREEIDRALFNSLTKNQSLLEDQNLTKETALNINLEEIAKGLIDSNVSKELPEQLEACANDNTCIDALVNNTTKEVELTEKEAQELARSKNVADGYIVKLNKPVVAVCANGKEYNSSLSVGEKGKIDFEAFPVGTECILRVASGAIIDSNNNGKFDEQDKPLEFEMIGLADDTFISPLTTLLFKKRKNGEDVAKFASMIKNFDPVTAPSRTLTNSGVEKVKIEKLIVLMEVLKTAMKKEIDISQLDLSGVITTRKTDNIDTLEINKLIKNFSEEVQSTISDKAKKIRQILNMLKTIDTKKVSIDSFVVAVSDGAKGIKNALTSSLLYPLPEGVDILDFVSISLNIATNDRPIAKAGADQKIVIGESVTLDGSKSSDTDGSILSYEWWDKDKEKLISNEVSITLKDLPIGVHNISLFVKDNNKAIGKDNMVITVIDKHILQLVGIAQEVVVNICQDSNANGSCDEGEFQAKVSMNPNDKIAKIWEKVKFEVDGQYVLEKYDSTLKIIMEIEDGKNLKSYGGKLVLEYKPTTKELSVLQAVVDADFLKEEEVKKFKKLSNREEIDSVLFNSLIKNQSLLGLQNLTKERALSLNLEEIAKGLIALDISKELEECSNNTSCIEELVTNIRNRIELTEKEAQELARSKNIADGYILKLLKPVEAICSNGKSYQSKMEVGGKGRIDFETLPLGLECTLIVASGATIDSNNNGILDDEDKLLTFEMVGSSNDTFITPLTTLLFKKKKNGEDVSKFASMIQNFNPVVAPNRVSVNRGVEKLELEKLIVLMEILKTTMKQSVDISLTDLSGIINTKSNETIDDLSIDTLIAKFPKEVKESISERADVIKKLINTIKDLDPTKISLNTFFVSVSDGGKNMRNALNESLLLSLPNGVDVFSFVLNPDSTGVLSNSNTIPIVEAGERQTVTLGQVFTLDGSKSRDKDGEIVEYTWKDRGKVLGTGSKLSLDSLSVGLHIITLVVKDNDGAVNTGIVVITVKDISIAEKVSLGLGNTLLLGSKSVTIAKNRPFNLQLSGNESLSNFYNIKLPKAKVNRLLKSTKINFKIKVVNQADKSDFVQLLLNNILISTDDEALLETKMSKDTTIYIKEQVQDRPTKTYSTKLSSEVVRSGLNIDIKSIINRVDKREITDGLERMEDYLQTSGKKYSLSIEITGVDNSELEIDFSSILGNISVR